MPAVPGRKRDNGIYVANTTFVCNLNGEQEMIRAGQTRVRAGHPLLDVYASYFDSVDLGVHYEVEQMTAGPGEKRGAPIT